LELGKEAECEGVIARWLLIAEGLALLEWGGGYLLSLSAYFLRDGTSSKSSGFMTGS
jgi:hypothetical protein